METQGYDPVVEYNKGIEIFDMHFSPKPEDLFTIILQISRFLKEFSDFETLTTPEFKHPFIQGKTVDKNTDKAYLKKEGATKIAKLKLETENEPSKVERVIDIKSFLCSHSKDAREAILKDSQDKHKKGTLPFRDGIQEFD